VDIVIGNYKGKNVGAILDNPEQKELNAWIKTQLNEAVRTFIDEGNIQSPLLEAKPAWVLPFQILIGKIRGQGRPKDFDWFICGDLPTDFLSSANASTPRDAARHFALKWHLRAARDQAMEEQSSPEAESNRSQVDDQLVEKAEALYGLVENTGLWLHKGEF
jgi:hypothetical protein